MFDDLPTNDNSQNLKTPYPTVPGGENANLLNGLSGQMVNGASLAGGNGGAASPIPTKPVEDIFLEAGAREKPAIFRPKESPTIGNQFGDANMAQFDPYSGEIMADKNKTIVFALMLISLMIVMILGWFAYKRFFTAMAPEIVETNVVSEPEKPVDKAVVEEKTEPEPVKKSFMDNKTVTVLDSDNDGLPDDEESSLGLNPLLADTDGDGLFDKEEVKIYKTNPLSMDTDRDSFSDGKEVKGGYNPNGEGRLYDLNKQ
jgi:Bacterial TSP3 repeat